MHTRFFSYSHLHLKTHIRHTQRHQAGSHLLFNFTSGAVLMIHGDKAHSCYFSRDAFARLQGDNKELLLIPGAVHTDLYDRMDIIPFDRIEAFYRQYLK